METQSKILSKSEMSSFFFEDPISGKFAKSLGDTSIEYFYYDKEFTIEVKDKQVANAGLLNGKSQLILGSKKFELFQFDMFFLPPNTSVQIIPEVEDYISNKICIVKTPIVDTTINPDIKFEIEKFEFNYFKPRGEFSSDKKMSTFRTVWTAFKNGYFMSGLTNIPNLSLKQGVLTSVNLVKNQNGKTEIYSHIHKGFPEIYIFCTSDKTTAVTQYLINEKGESIAKEMYNGEGLLFPGNLGHMNFSKPNYKNLKYCIFMWIIGTYGKTSSIEPESLKV
jgi:hypothetical protein